MLPRLLHPIPVVIERLDTDNTIYDENAREPIGLAARKTSVTIDAQISYDSSQIVSEFYGNTIKTNGYLIFRRVDLESANIMPVLEDKIVKLGTGDAAVTTALYIVGIDYRAHYPDQGGWTLLKCWYSDKQPSKQ